MDGNNSVDSNNEPRALMGERERERKSGGGETFEENERKTGERKGRDIFLKYKIHQISSFDILPLYEI